MKCPVCGNETEDNVCIQCGYLLEEDLRLQRLLHQLSQEEIEQYHIQLHHYQKMHQCMQDVYSKIETLQEKINDIENVKNQLDMSKTLTLKQVTLDDLECFEDVRDYVDLLEYLVDNPTYVMRSEYFLEMEPFPYSYDLDKAVKRHEIFSLNLGHNIVGCMRVKYSNIRSAVVIYNFYCDSQEYVHEMIRQFKAFIPERYRHIQACCHYSHQEAIKKYEGLGFVALDRLGNKKGELILELKDKNNSI